MSPLSATSLAFFLPASEASRERTHEQAAKPGGRKAVFVLPLNLHENLK